MADVRAHYEDLLAGVYSWMAGGLDHQLDLNRRRLDQLGIGPGDGQRALDLGAGSGFQSIPLAERGYRVTAVDLSGALLAELRRAAGDLPVETVERDMLPVAACAPEEVALVVCMGDTLSHLRDHEDVEQLVRGVFDRLEPGGTLVLAYRDLTHLPEGADRFIPVRSERDRVFTCFLEAIDERRVRVHDLLHERHGDGFRLRVSAYEKLRLGAAWLDDVLTDSGFEIVTRLDERLVTRVARRPRV